MNSYWELLERQRRLGIATYEISQETVNHFYRCGRSLPLYVHVWWGRRCVSLFCCARLAGSGVEETKKQTFPVFRHVLKFLEFGIEITEMWRCVKGELRIGDPSKSSP